MKIGEKLAKIKGWLNSNKFKIKAFFKKWVGFFLNPRFLLCFLLGWFITNGWSYVMFAFGTIYQIDWMILVSTAYLSFLWAPLSPEKIVTLIIAIFLLKKFFPDDEKTLKVLVDELEKAKRSIKRRKQKKASKKS